MTQNGKTSKNKGKEGKKGDNQKVSFHKLFAFADYKDIILMTLGTICSIANGVCQPLMSLIFGDVINSFGSTNTDLVVHAVSKGYPLFKLI
ncbi:hypothetical protein RJ641_005129 [Dillenia turbinata]|uniref:Uncharacterized protein n=1 Tax=Dillenia turbinata TaxID=194707 RepID=A0AAN8VC87_9MAGN